MEDSRVAIAALVCAVGLLSSSGALADDAQQRAKVTFQEGLTHFEAGRYQAAVEKFREAHKISPSWKLHFNIGQCEAVLKNYGRALESFEAYLVEGGDDVPQDRQTEVRTEISRLRDLSGEVQVKAPPGCQVYIDGNERGRTPIIGGILVGAGVREVKVVHEGSILLKQEVRIRGKKTVRVEVSDEPGSKAAVVPVAKPEEPEPETEPNPEPEPEPVVPPDDQPTDPEDEPVSKKLVLGGVLAGVGGAAMVAGFVTGGVARAKTKDLEDRCPDKQCPDESDKELHDEAVNLSRTADVLVPVGAALAVAGVVLIIMDLNEESPDATAFGVMPVAGPGQAGVVFERRF